MTDTTIVTEIAELRQRFEAWCDDERIDTRRSDVNSETYFYPNTVTAWRAWQSSASRALPAAPDAGDEKRVKVPEGQTPLDDNLNHRYLAVLDEGSKARDSGEGSPYHGHSLEHCLHATGWVSRDLRLALNKAHEDSKTIREQARRDAYAKCRSVIGRHYRATVTAPDGDDHTYGMRLTLNSVDCEIEALAEAKS